MYAAILTSSCVLLLSKMKEHQGTSTNICRTEKLTGN